MLVLGRKVNEKVLIGTDGIEVTVLEIRGNRVRLGIAAPRETLVDRKEVRDRRNKEAALADQANGMDAQATGKEPHFLSLNAQPARSGHDEGDASQGAASV